MYFIVKNIIKSDNVHNKSITKHLYYAYKRNVMLVMFALTSDPCKYHTDVYRINKHVISS